MKELPYFKFYPSQWITGNISFLTFEEQGAFMKACCFYWAQECKLKTQQVKRIIPEELYNSLLDNGLIKSDGEFIIISWLDEQLEERQKRHKANVKNGRKGGKISAELRATNQARVEHGSSVAVEHDSSIKIRKDKKRKEKIKEDNIRKDNIDPSLSTKGIKEFLKLREDDNK